MSARPQLNGILANNTKRHFAIAACLAFANVFLARYMLNTRNSEPMERYFKYTDPQVEFDRMKRNDLLQSVSPSGLTMSAAKPQLVGLLASRTKAHFMRAGILAVIATIGYKFGVYDRNHNQIQDYFKRTDMNARYEAQKAAGVYQWVSEMEEE